MGFGVQPNQDGSQGYDQDHFHYQVGNLCYTVMQFGLKNAEATFQRMAMALQHDMMHNEVKVYVDDMIVKSKDRGSHKSVPLE